MINSLSIIIVLAIVGLTIPVMNVNAGDRNCDVDVNHPYCTGEEGASGMVYCDLAYSNPADVDMYGDCYNRDFSTIDCHEHPNHSRCIGFEGREGNIFCDVQYEDLGYYDNCYDRKDTPDKYCDKYAKEESAEEWTAEFCQNICLNFEAVIDRGEDCDNSIQDD